MKKITAKDIRIAVKRHRTISELTEEYQFETEADFISAIHRIFTQKSAALGIISSLKKNEKKKSSATHEVSMSATSSGPVLDPPSTSESVSATVSLSEKLVEEETLSSQLVDLENTHKQLVSSHLNSKKELERMQRILLELQRLMNAHQSNLSQELQKIQATSHQMASITQQINSTRAHLTKVRAEIKNLQQVSIFVYANGSMDAENGELPAISDESINSKFMELIQLPRAKEFAITLKDVTTIAKLLLVTENLASSKLAFEISFDSDEVEKFYEAVTAPTA